MLSILPPLMLSARYRDEAWVLINAVFSRYQRAPATEETRRLFANEVEGVCHILTRYEATEFEEDVLLVGQPAESAYLEYFHRGEARWRVALVQRRLPGEMLDTRNGSYGTKEEAAARAKKLNDSLKLSPEALQAILGGGEVQPKRQADPLLLTNWLKANGVDLLNQDPAYWRKVECQARQEGVFIPPPSPPPPPPLRWNHRTLREARAPQPPKRRKWPEPKRAMVKEMRRLRRAAILEGLYATPQAQYGETVGQWLSAELERFSATVDDPCKDNFRWARLRSKGDLRRFRRRAGCCGSTSAVVVCPHAPYKGERFLLAFNFGH